VTGTGPVTGDDAIARCPWGSGSPMMQEYHDTEWGTSVVGEAAYFERLTLEAFQSGLSWAVILRKRPAFREAFAGFDPDAVAAFDAADVGRLMADTGIVRNRRKVDATIMNARATVALRGVDDPAGAAGLEDLLVSFAPEDGPAPRTVEEVPATSAQSLALSKELKRRGFSFVGPTTMHALMEALGLVDTHLLGCHRRGVR